MNPALDDSYGWRLLWSYLALMFLGIFGAHRFYLGRWRTGLVYLFTGGVCGLGVLVDFVLLPCMALDIEDGTVESETTEDETG